MEWMPIILTIIFFIALASTMWFLGRLATWMVYKIAPENCLREFTRKDINKSNMVGAIGLLMWTLLFYLIIS